METPDYHRELIFDTNDRLSAVRMISFFPDDDPRESIIKFYYDTGERIDSSSAPGHNIKYTYEAELLTRSDEYIDELHAHYHTFEYDARKRISQTLSWQYFVDQSEWVPRQKSTYSYDSNDNLIENTLYYYNSGTANFELLARFLYSDYDNAESFDRHFSIAPFNPMFKIRRNNPGKMEVQNRHGNTTAVEVYSYAYHNSGLPERCTTSVTFPFNGETGSYETKFIYEVR